MGDNDLKCAKFRVGVVGAGSIGELNARSVLKSQVAIVAAVCDRNFRAGRTLARQVNAAFVGDYEEMLSRPDVDSILLCVPHHLHAPFAIQAARAGKHVLVEKPLAISLGEGTAMLRACEEAGVALTVNFSFRYLPRVQEAKALIEAEALGEVVGIEIRWHQEKGVRYWSGATSGSPSDWRGSKTESGGGVLLMSACHPVDYLRYITGLEVVRVYAEYGALASPAGVEVEDIISVSCRYANGAIGTVSASSNMRGSWVRTDRVWGTQGTLEIAPKSVSFYSTRPILGKKPGKWHRFSRFPKVDYTAEWIRRFVLAISRGEAPEISGLDGWINLAVIRSAYDSLKAGRPIDVPLYHSEMAGD